ncbi:sensor domain-containing diguanylate cyclase [Mycobacterium sp. shizuoka-1]|uniref:sensor domain-containing diguanylate cyclase n=1 Tax=Mycobacterium sp. shizuoka-1 TaxID=2039281 RepID=UPI000C05EDAA|nr:sensor domain-containing diguanylate cyclase [Mycobacterium sp. shizuoka-1]GAY19210.1 hypothetical protein MSZK_59360 [Mycobacterium sp. shizuoka-1]
MAIRRVLVVGDPFADPAILGDALRDTGSDVHVDRTRHPDDVRDWRAEVVIVDDDWAPTVLQRSALSGSPVVVVSDRPAVDVAVELIRRGAADYLSSSDAAGLGRALVRVAERAAGHQERLAGLLLRHSQDVIVSVDHRGDVVVAGAAAESMLGYRPEELAGSAFATLIHDEDVESMLAAVRAAARGEVICDVECRCRHRSGDIRHVVWSLLAAEGDVFTLLGRDVTDRRRAEAKVSQERDYADAIINSLPGIFFHYDEGMRLLRWNRTMAQTTGYSDEDLAAMHPFEFIAASDRGLAADLIDGLFESGTTRGEMRYVFKDGTEAPHVFQALRFDYDGRPGWMGIGVDISEQKRMEEQLRTETALFEAMVQNAPDAILVVDRDNRTIIHNQRFRDVWGIPPEIADARLLEFIIGRTKDPETFGTSMPERSDETSSDEVELVDGTILHRLSGPVIGRDGRSYGRIWSFRDITEYRHAERRLRHLATHDALTGLANRNLLVQSVEHAIALARSSADMFAVLFVDMDRFKVVNDRYGHAFGDAVLRAVGERLLGLVGPPDTVARLGGDEFLVLLLPPCDADRAEATARRIVEALGAPLPVDGIDVHLAGSVGVSLFPRDGETLDSLLTHADLAMYRQKGHGAHAAPGA